MGQSARKVDGSAASVSPITLDDPLAQEIIRGVRSTFSDMFRAEIAPGTPQFGKDLSVEGDISGTVGLVQERIEGTMSVCFERSAILALLAPLYGQTLETSDRSVRDGVGEITNIIYCLIKKYLNDRGHRLKMAIPNVVMGDHHNIVSMHRDGYSLRIPFKAAHGQFQIQITLQHS